MLSKKIFEKAGRTICAATLAIAMMSSVAFADSAVTTNSRLDLNGRSGPGTNYSVVVKIPPNSAIDTTGSSRNGFVQVVYKGQTIWVSQDYVKVTSNNSSRTGYTTNQSKNLNMRSSASTSASIIKKIPPHSTVTVYGNPSNGFYKVSYGGSTGYVSADYISFSKPSYNKRDEAVNWVAGLVGQSIDYDGAYGAQCVDLIKYYYKHLGVSPVKGNGKDYVWNNLPKGWTRIQGAKPQKGDILVFTRGKNGHVAIYVSDSVSYHQNYNGVKKIQKISTPYYNMKGYWGVIRPSW